MSEPADTKRQPEKQRPKPAPVGGSLRAAMMDFMAGKPKPTPPPPDRPGPELPVCPDLGEEPFE